MNCVFSRQKGHSSLLHRSEKPVFTLTVHWKSNGPREGHERRREETNHGSDQSRSGEIHHTNSRYRRSLGTFSALINGCVYVYINGSAETLLHSEFISIQYVPTLKVITQNLYVKRVRVLVPFICE